MPRPGRKEFTAWLWDQLLAHDLRTMGLSTSLDFLDADVEDWAAERAVPTPEECRRLAEFFEVPAECVLRLAGYLP